jgi:hypothetical protein
MKKICALIALATLLTACPLLPPMSQTFRLTLTPANGGTILEQSQNIACGATCSAEVAQNTQVTLSATPKAQFVFSSWTGDCSGQANPCVLNMTANKTVGAVFQTFTGSFSPVLEPRDPILPENSETKLEVLLNPDAGFDIPISAVEISATGKYIGNSDVLIRVKLLPDESSMNRLVLSFQTPRLSGVNLLSFTANLVIQVGQVRKTIPMTITVLRCSTCTGGQP